MRCYLFDIDGTVANCSHRLHHISGATKDWGAFFAACDRDEPISHIVGLIQDLRRGGNRIVYVSGRSDECRLATIEWLARHKVFSAHLYMRKAGDHRPDNIVKIELLQQLRQDGFDPIMAFDDRNQVVEAWRTAGLPCAQVAPGDF